MDVINDDKYYIYTILACYCYRLSCFHVWPLWIHPCRFPKAQPCLQDRKVSSATRQQLHIKPLFGKADDFPAAWQARTSVNHMSISPRHAGFTVCSLVSPRYTQATRVRSTITNSHKQTKQPPNANTCHSLCKNKHGFPRIHAQCPPSTANYWVHIGSNTANVGWLCHLCKHTRHT